MSAFLRKKKLSDIKPVTSNALMVAWEEEELKLLLQSKINMETDCNITPLTTI